MSKEMDRRKEKGEKRISPFSLLLSPVRLLA
jgi:hypothetical protein